MVVWHLGKPFMLKKTTVYIEEGELDTLKSLSLIQNKSVAELIRCSIKKVCQSVSLEEKKALKTLSKIRKNSKRKAYSSQQIMTMAVKAQREIRSESKKQKSHCS